MYVGYCIYLHCDHSTEANEAPSFSTAWSKHAPLLQPTRLLQTLYNKQYQHLLSMHSNVSLTSIFISMSHIILYHRYDILPFLYLYIYSPPKLFPRLPLNHVLLSRLFLALRFPFNHFHVLLHCSQLLCFLIEVLDLGS